MSEIGETQGVGSDMGCRGKEKRLFWAVSCHVPPKFIYGSPDLRMRLSLEKRP